MSHGMAFLILRMEIVFGTKFVCLKAGKLVIMNTSALIILH